VLKEHKIYCEFYLDDVIYVDTLAKDAEKKPNIYRLPSVELGEAVYEMPLVTKLSICMENKEDQPRLTKLIQDIEGSENLIIFPSVGLHIEINSIQANKGDTVKWIANHLGISLDKVMAIGDAENDIPMLDIAGYPVVMGQANENMKKGRLVTERVENAGVAVAIEKYCFGIEN
jgi:hydroxymethylpyrimidine pyrophosphatase-like HAD family hydrolase